MPVSTVQPVNYQRARVSGLDSLQERMRGIDEDGRSQTNALRQALAQRQEMDRIEKAKKEAAAAAQQQALYNQQLKSAFDRSQQQGQQQPSGPTQIERARATGKFDNGSVPLGDGSIGAQAVKLASKYIGMPYKWGGSSPATSFDCSGLIQYVYKQLGVKLPRVSNQQAMSGTRTSISNLRPGDLAAWDNSSRNKGADHIAIYVGNNTILEAARAGTNIRYRKLSDKEMNSGWGVRVRY